MNDLTNRDLSLIRLAYRFRQLTSNHIHELLFRNVHKTMTDRALKRLVERGYLIRIERRIVGGARGGSGQYVYALGRGGWRIVTGGTADYRPMRNVQFHALAIADLYIALRRLETAAGLSIAGLSVEPDCWAVVGRWELKPDLYVELERVGAEGKRLAWFEVDLATEGQKQVREKLDVVWRAYSEVDASQWAVWPLTVWVAVDEERERELRWIIGKMPEQARGLFRVCRLETLPGVLGLSYPQA